MTGTPTVVTWSDNAWVALATGPNGKYGTAGVHDSQYDADQAALERCGPTCTIAADAYALNCN